MRGTIWALMGISAILLRGADLEQSALALIQKRCLECHSGPSRMAGLDLTTLDGARKGGANGPALAPGDAAASLIYQRVSKGEMPLGKPLPAAERDLLRQWIAAGAPWTRAIGAVTRPKAGPDWWSLQPVNKPDPPNPPGLPAEWSRSPIDRFVFARMADKGLRPAPPAGRSTLIRRATFDLTGLPPTPEEIQAFLDDPGENAYETLIDRLLASPHYGERWGRHWLDVIRFGESHGYEQNHLRERAWPFRDYVIRSFNRDTPFSQMILEHLAGDQVAAGNPEVELGTGFLVAGVHDTVTIQNIEGKLQQRADDLDDMINATAAGFLGLTVTCARCHDHKFDPIPQADYYRLQAVFAGVRHEERVYATAEEVARRRRAERPLRDRLAGIQREISAIEAAARPRVDQQRDAVLARFRPPVDSRGTEEILQPVQARFVRMNILETNGGPATIDELEIWTADPDPRNVAAAAKAAARATRTSDGDPMFYSVDHVNDGKFDKRWISGEPGGRGQVTLELPKVETIARVFWSRDRLGAFQERFLNSVPTLYTLEVSADGNQWREVASSRDRLPYSAAARGELVLLAVFDAAENKRWNTLKKEKAEAEQQLARLPALPAAYIGAFAQPEEPAHLLVRGNPMVKGEAVAPGALSVLDPVLPPLKLAPDAPEGERRLALARWIADPRNPLTPRVLVNRLWHYHFGRGIAGAPSDFGLQGQPPTHPELLDWLAWRLLTVGWRLKPLHREIMLSAAYRQASTFQADHARIDAEARYLWRFPPRRLEAEAIRDAILAVSGKLDRTMGGPGFRLYKYTVDNVATYYPLEKPGPETFRRSVYHQAPRSVRVELLGEYDCPDSTLPEPNRAVTSSPLQALTLLNSTFLLDQARFFAERLQSEVPGDAKRQAERAFLLAYGRAPETAEVEQAVSLIERYGLPVFCRAILNANELLYVM